MKIKNNILIIVFFVSLFSSPVLAQKETIVLMKTNMGNIKFKLYNTTPLHRDNMVKLINQNYYNGLLFHRVIKEFMIQAGDPASKGAEAGKQLGAGGPGYTVPAEIKAINYHKKGAIAAARQGDQMNPARASSGSQFYIVVGKTYNDEALNQVEQSIQQNIKMGRIRTFMMLPENENLRKEVTEYQKSRNAAKLDSIQNAITAKIDLLHHNEPAFQFTKEQREVYKTIGGTPFLDMTYTVFGEVIEGIDVVDKIATVTTLQGDRPEKDVVIESMKVVK